MYHNNLDTNACIYSKGRNSSCFSILTIRNVLQQSSPKCLMFIALKSRSIQEASCIHALATDKIGRLTIVTCARSI